MEKKIQQLTELWYELVILDHHKDRDCHWYINTTYSYGYSPKFTIEHYGYIGDEINEEETTYARAEERLYYILKEAFDSESKWATDVLKKKDGWDEEQINRAERIQKIVEKVNEL